MYKKTLIFLALILLVAGVGTFLMVRENRDKPVSLPVETIPTEPVVYVSAETNETIDVRYATDTAVMNGLRYRDVEFRLVEAASGAKYESRKENLILWSKGDEITLTRGRQQLFVGTDANVVSNGIRPPVIIPDTGTTSEEVVATTTEEVIEESAATSTEAL